MDSTAEPMERAEHRHWSDTYDYYTHTPTRSARDVLLYPLETGLYPMETGHETERGSYPSFEIMRLDGGSMDITNGSTHAVARDGDFILVDCYTYHHYVALEPTNMLWLHFDGVSARYYCERIVARLGIVFSLDDPGDVASAAEPLNAIYTMFRSGTVNEPLAARYLTDMLTAMLLAVPGGGRHDREVRRVMAYISNHLAEPLDVGRLAAMANMGERNFTRAFKQESGYTPHAYVMAARMDRARKMLANSDASVQEICVACGYSQPAVFCGAFKASVGKSPLEYRQAVAA